MKSYKKPNYFALIEFAKLIELKYINVVANYSCIRPYGTKCEEHNCRNLYPAPLILFNYNAGIYLVMAMDHKLNILSNIN